MADTLNTAPAAPVQDEAQPPIPLYVFRKRRNTRWWEVLDPHGELVCLTVYRKGAREVVRRLAA
jgi:hypothetical protein